MGGVTGSQMVGAASGLMGGVTGIVCCRRCILVLFLQSFPLWQWLLQSMPCFLHEHLLVPHSVVQKHLLPTKTFHGLDSEAASLRQILFSLSQPSTCRYVVSTCVLLQITSTVTYLQDAKLAT